MVATFTECVSFGLIEPAGAYGADIVCGEGQSIGNALNFGWCHGGCFGLTCGYQEDAAGKGDGLQEGAAEKVHSYFKLVC